MQPLDFKDTNTPISHCPTCARQLDTVTSIRGKSPRPGDFTICLYCAQVMVFQKDLGRRKATQEEILGIEANNPDFLKLQGAVLKTMDHFKAEVL